MKVKYLLFIIPILILNSCRKDLEFADLNHSLPVMHITIKEKYLWSPDSGLYIIGSNGIIGPKGLVANYNQKWEFPARVSLYIDNYPVFNEKVGFRIKGNYNRIRAMKSIGLYWRKRYGNSKLTYKLFKDINLYEFERLHIRNSGSDFGHTQIKDATIQQIIKSESNVDYQEYQPCVLYLNNKYWGIHNIREMVTSEKFKHQYNIDHKSMDLLGQRETYPTIYKGSRTEFLNEVIKFIRSNNLSENENYEDISKIIDIESYVDYIIIQTYIANRDWHDNNVRWWRDKTSINHKKWKWVIVDTDLSFETKTVNNVWIGDLYGQPFEIGRVHSESLLIFNNLIKNKQFKEFFLNRYLYFLDNVFEKNRVKNIILKNQNQIAMEYPNHQKKWNTLSKRAWESEIEEMIEFNNRRNDIMRNVIINLKSK